MQAYRVEKFNRPREIIVKLLHYKDKQIIQLLPRNLKEHRFTSMKTTLTLSRIIERN